MSNTVIIVIKDEYGRKLRYNGNLATLEGVLKYLHTVRPSVLYTQRTAHGL